MTMCFQLEDESTERTEQNGIYSQKKCRKMRKIEWLTDWTVSLVSLGIKASEHKSTRHLQQSANHRHFQLPGIKCFPFLFPFLLCHFTTILFAISPICSIRENKWCSTRRCEERPAEQRPAVVSLHFRFIRDMLSLPDPELNKHAIHHINTWGDSQPPSWILAAKDFHAPGMYFFLILNTIRLLGCFILQFPYDI